MALMDSLFTARRELHCVLWDNDYSFPICRFIMMVASKHRLMLPAAVAVHILSFLGEAGGGVHRYIKSDELYARSIVLGEHIRQAEKLVLLPVF